MARRSRARSGKKGCFPWWVVVLLLVLLIGGAGGGKNTKAQVSPAPHETVDAAPVSKADAGEPALTLTISEDPEPTPAEIPETRSMPEPETTEPPAVAAEPTPEPTPEPQTFVLNTSSMKYHDPYCSSVDDMKESNKRVFEGTREEVEAMGYQACKRCGG